TDMKSILIDKADSRRQSSTAAIASANAVILIVAGIGILGSIVLAFFLTRSIVRPISMVNASLRDIAEGEGDLTVRVNEKGSDELAQLGKGFNKFVGRVHGIISEIAGASQEVASSAAQIAAASEELATGFKNQNDQAAQISAAAEQMSASIIEVARKAEDATSSSQQAGEVACRPLGHPGPRPPPGSAAPSVPPDRHC
ncbi:MAG: methyl-accepting chemotaxis protein, partial [Pseudomonadota bacterium]